MATVKLYLRKHKNGDGTSPLVIKVFKDGKPSISHIGVNLLDTDWDATKQRVKKSHANSTRLNNFLLKKLAEANDKTLEARTIDENVSSKTIIKKIKPKSNHSFFARADAFMKDLQATGNFNEYNANEPRLKHFREFLGGSDIVFPDITPNLLERYKTHLRATRKVGKAEKPIKERTVLNHLVIIRSVFSKAIEDGYVERKYYPFGKEGISIKMPESEKIGLSIEDVRNLENVELAKPNYNHARNLWLMSFYFGGMRISDVLRLRWSDFQDDRLHYTMGKNNKPGSLKADEKVFYILQQYEQGKRHKDDFIFPELKELKNIHDEFEVKKVINDCAVRNDKFLRKFVAPTAGITHRITLHIARHTFGNIAGESIDIKMLQKIFRHSSITTTINYMANFRHKDADDALASVLNADKPKVVANDNSKPVTAKKRKTKAKIT